MWTISVHPRGEAVGVTVSRWETGARYPTVLMDFELLRNRNESELALLQRVAVAVEREGSRQRHGEAESRRA